MKPRLLFPAALVFVAALPLLSERPAQHPPSQNPPRANQGHVPPPPPSRPQPQAKPEPEHHQSGHVNTTPHVDHPYDHGHFEHFGPSYRYNVIRVDRDHHRFWLPGGFYFEVAAWDWPLCADWCWDCGDDFTVYEDPDHPGWYMVYNIHTGAYVHVTYMGT